MGQMVQKPQAIDYVSFLGNTYIQNSKEPGSERNITMVTHLEDTHTHSGTGTLVAMMHCINH